MIADFLKKTFHIPKFAPGGITEKPIIDVPCDPPEFIVPYREFDEAMENLKESLERIRNNEELKIQIERTVNNAADKED